tara:strand:+ start:13684 stop:14784 length:1101 start_codon:yes stop_codon:yes gene_type:complete
MHQTVSKSSNKKIIIILSVVVLVIAVGLVAYPKWLKLIFSGPASDSDLLQPDVSIPSVDLVMPSAPKPYQTTQPETVSEMDLMVEELSGRMKKQFAENIHLVAIQVGLKRLRDDLNRTFPEQGNALFVRILRNAFPEWVSAILNAIALMDEYDAWLEAMLVSLNDMNPLEQQGTLWEKRRELFGDAATQIWQEEISAEQERQMTMRRTMEVLDRSYDTQMQERLYLLQSTFEESYADKIQNMIIDPKGVLAQVFFGFDAVQKDLSVLSPEARQAQINEIRKTMGFSEEQIKAQAESDQKREKRWQNGYAYMAARKAAESKFTGDKLLQELDSIREKFFANEASTIKKEEEDLAFFRYTRPRVYGRN